MPSQVSPFTTKWNFAQFPTIPAWNGAVLRPLVLMENLALLGVVEGEVPALVMNLPPTDVVAVVRVGAACRRYRPRSTRWWASVICSRCHRSRAVFHLDYHKASTVPSSSPQSTSNLAWIATKVQVTRNSRHISCGDIPSNDS